MEVSNLGLNVFAFLNPGLKLRVRRRSGNLKSERRFLGEHLRLLWGAHGLSDSVRRHLRSNELASVLSYEGASPARRVIKLTT